MEWLFLGVACILVYALSPDEEQSQTASSENAGQKAGKESGNELEGNRIHQRGGVGGGGGGKPNHAGSGHHSRVVKPEPKPERYIPPKADDEPEPETTTKTEGE